MTIEHSDIQFGEMHPVANWVVTSGGVAALSSIPVGDADIGKQAWVSGVGHYTLAATSPVVWEASSVTISSFAYNGDTGDLTITLSSGDTLQVTIPLGLREADVNNLIADALSILTTANIPPSTNRNYVTDAQLVVVGNTSGTNSGDETQATIKTKLGAASSGADGYITAANFTSFDTAYTHSQATGNPHGTAITDISGLSTALSGKEPAIASGTSAQYIRGDKSLATLNTDAVPETASRVYLSPAQKTVATQAATATLNGYLSSTDWSTFNGKQAALADVITANTYGNSTQWPIVTVNAKGIVTGVTLQTVPTLTDATFSVQKNGSPSITASWSLTALTASRVHTYPNKDINFGDLPSVATNDTNSIALAALRCRILGGSGNTVSGTDNIVIGGIGNVATGTRSILINCTAAGASGNDVIALNVRSPNASNLEANSILLGTSKQTDLFMNVGTAAALRLNALYALSSAIPTSGTLYATIDGSQTLSASNLVLGVNDTGDCATHEVEFMVCVGAANGFGGVSPTGYFIAKRRIVAFRAPVSGTFFVSAVQTIGTDVTLGTLAGTITPNLSIDTTTGSATIHRLLCKIDRTGGVAGQEVVAMSVRVTSHHSR